MVVVLEMKVQTICFHCRLAVVVNADVHGLRYGHIIAATKYIAVGATVDVHASAVQFGFYPRTVASGYLIAFSIENLIYGVAVFYCTGVCVETIATAKQLADEDMTLGLARAGCPLGAGMHEGVVIAGDAIQRGVGYHFRYSG